MPYEVVAVVEDEGSIHDLEEAIGVDSNHSYPYADRWDIIFNAGSAEEASRIWHLLNGQEAVELCGLSDVVEIDGEAEDDDAD